MIAVIVVVFVVLVTAAVLGMARLRTPARPAGSAFPRVPDGSRSLAAEWRASRLGPETAASLGELPYVQHAPVVLDNIEAVPLYREPIEQVLVDEAVRAEANRLALEEEESRLEAYRIAADELDRSQRDSDDFASERAGGPWAGFGGSRGLYD